MVSWPQRILVLVLSLLLTACGSASGNIAGDIQAAQGPAVLQPTTPPATRTESPVVLPTGLPNVGIMSHNPPDTCPISRSANPTFTPPPPYPRSAPGDDEFWYGTDSLWTAVGHTGVWSGLPHNPEGYTQKVFWWRAGYSVAAEPQPHLTVTGRRLDAAAPPLIASRATNASAPDIQSAMLVGVGFPTLGCWEITGQYAGTELSFVVWVAP
jgi:hypothetical protein